MSTQLRIWMFAAAVSAFAALFVWGLTGLAPFGNYPGPYGDIVNSITVQERHVTDVVTAVNFDYRGFDTLGEEFILFNSVLGVLLLLRRLRDEQEKPPEEKASDESMPRSSDAVRVLAFVLTEFMVLWGLYTVAHGQLTPGGGFQGGVILASGPVLVFLTGGYKAFRQVTSPMWIEVAECVGAGSYALIGLGALIAGAPFLQNVLPLGHVGSVFSGGTIPLINLSTGLEVTSGFVLLLTAFLEETYLLHQRGEQ